MENNATSAPSLVMNSTHKRKTAVKYDDLEDAHLYVSAGGSFDAAAYVCRETGKIYCESPECGDEFEVPENVGDDEKFAEIPDKCELDLGQRLVFRFVRESIPEHYEDVADMFRRRGAYGRFKELLSNLAQLEAWHAFESASTEEALRLWAEEEGFVVIPETKAETKRVYQFKIELNDLNLPIWRRIQVPETYSFWDLHVAIQDAMGWLDYHLHAFRIADSIDKSIVVIGIPDEFESPHDKTLPGWETPIADYFDEVGSAADYEYDFGDGWIHRIILDGVLVADPGTIYPICVGGERACPPEDCGGIPGYERLIHALRNPEADGSEELVEWVEADFDPDRFAPDDVKFDDPDTRWEKAFKH